MFKHSMPRKVSIVIALILLVRFVFLLSIGFVDDDAYHWSWTQMPMLSYYDHPGMIAWLEWLTTKIFGNTKLGIRLPSFICFAAMVYLLWHLCREFFNERAANLFLVIFLLSPIWGIGGYAAAPETPFMIFWTLAFWVFYQGIKTDNPWSARKTWLMLGLIMGLGLNSKFPMALMAFGFGFYLLTHKQHLKVLLTPWPWVGILIATVMCLPIFIWNVQYDWPGFKYQFHDRHADGGFDLNRWLGFLGTQVAVLSPGLLALVFYSAYQSAKRFSTISFRFALSVFIPSFLIFYFQPLFADYKPHWMGPVYLLMIMMGCGLIYNSRGWKIAVFAFLIPLNILVYSSIMTPLIPKVHRMISSDPWKPEYDFTNEFYGWDELGPMIVQLKQKYQSANPIIASHRYETTAQTMLSITRAGMTDRVWMLNTTRSHYTVMQTAGEIDQLKGRDALFVVTNKYFVDPKAYAQFDQCEPNELKTYRGSELARVFTVFYCKNFQGII